MVGGWVEVGSLVHRILALMLSVSLVQRTGKVRDKIAALNYPVRFCIWYGLFLMVVLMGAYGVGYDSSQFIYNQF